MKKLLMLYLMSCMSVMAHAAEKMDFEFDVTGSERPALVFTNGKDTFIQPAPDQRIEIKGMPAEPRGPYVVVTGVHKKISIAVNGKAAAIHRLGYVDTPVNTTKKSTKPSVRKEEVCEQSGSASKVSFMFSGADIASGDMTKLKSSLSGYEGAVKAEVYGKKEWSTSVQRVASLTTWLVKQGVDPDSFSVSYVSSGLPKGQGVLHLEGRECKTTYTVDGGTDSVSEEDVEYVAPRKKSIGVSHEDAEESVDTSSLILRKGDLLSEKTKQYAKANGVKVVWQANREMRMKKDVSVSPQGDDVVGMLADLLRVFDYAVVESDQLIKVTDKEGVNE